MVAVLQVVDSASLEVSNKVVSHISAGALIFVGVEESDSLQDVELMAKQIFKTRIFPDSEGKINLNAVTANRQILLVSNFTLMANLLTGNRPSFTLSANKQKANDYYELLAVKLKELGVSKVATGVFGEHMVIDAKMTGPINIIIDSKVLAK